MDTRQLATFCAVVERESFSQAAERLGVTQPAVSLQVRALEERLGVKLLDRAGRRVEPTEAGRRLYRYAQRLLQVEERLLEDVAGADGGFLTGTLAIGASTGPGAHLVPLLLCEFQLEHPELRVSLSVWDTQAVIERVADRDVELGVVGAARRHRSLVFEPLARDEIVLAVPPGHPAAGGEVAVDDLRAETLLVMQEGAGVRQVVEEELRRAGLRLRSLDPRLELGPAGVGEERRRGRVRSRVHLAHGDRGRARRGHARLRPGHGARAVATALRRPGERPLADAGGRGLSGVRPCPGRRVIVRWGLDSYPEVLAELGIERPLLITHAQVGSPAAAGRGTVLRRPPARSAGDGGGGGRRRRQR